MASEIKKVGEVEYKRILIKTELIHIKQDLLPLIKEKVVPICKEGNLLVISEKVVTISQGRVVHQSVVHPGWLAKLVVKGVKKYDNDIGYSDAKKMQVAIYQSGAWRIFLAMIFGTLTKLIGRRGDFYRIAGNRISEIDGFNPDAMPPFDEFAMIGPENPSGYCNEIAKQFDIPCAIVDANNINVEVLGVSDDSPLDRATIRLALLDNPMGQQDEMTPMVLIRKI